MSNESVVVDHPERLGRLAEVFVRRRIAFAVDGRGELVLVRPDSVVVDVGDTPEAFAAALAAIARFDERQAGEIRQSERRAGGLVAVRVPNERADRHPRRAALGRRAGAAGARPAARRPAPRAEPNHVMLGSQGVRGFPVGGETYFAGGMMFTADIVETDVGPVLKTTSDPAPQPAWLPQPLALAGHTAPKVLILDTGLRTVDGKGAAVEHPYLTCARLHSPWLQAAPAGAIDDEDEFDDDKSGTLDFEAGHGTFITGIIQQLCPDAEVHIAGVLSSFGDGDVANVVGAFELRRHHGRSVRPRGHEPRRLHERRRRRAVRRRPARGCSATGSASRPPATSRRRARTSLPRCPTSSASAGSGRPTRRGSRTSAGGSMHVHRPSTSSARSSSAPTTTSTSRSPAGPAGAARASPRPRSPA